MFKTVMLKILKGTIGWLDPKSFVFLSDEGHTHLRQFVQTNLEKELVNLFLGNPPSSESSFLLTLIQAVGDVTKKTEGLASALGKSPAQSPPSPSTKTPKPPKPPTETDISDLVSQLMGGLPEDIEEGGGVVQILGNNEDGQKKVLKIEIPGGNVSSEDLEEIKQLIFDKLSEEEKQIFGGLGGISEALSVFQNLGGKTEPPEDPKQELSDPWSFMNASVYLVMVRKTSAEPWKVYHSDGNLVQFRSYYEAKEFAEALARDEGLETTVITGGTQN